MEMKNEEFELTHVFLTSFFRIHRHFGKWLHATMINNDLNVPQFIILQSMPPKQIIPQKILGKKLLFPKSTLSSSVDGLVSLGLLQRIISEENRREVSLLVTEAGKEKLQAVYNDPDGLHQKMSAILTQVPKESIRTLLEIHSQLYELMLKEETTEIGGNASDKTLS